MVTSDKILLQKILNFRESRAISLTLGNQNN